MTGASAAQQIDAIIKIPGDRRGVKLAEVRALIKEADPAVVEEVKWKKPSRPEGVPVWAHGGIICVADTLKQAVRLTFRAADGPAETLQHAPGEQNSPGSRHPRRENGR